MDMDIPSLSQKPKLPKDMLDIIAQKLLFKSGKDLCVMDLRNAWQTNFMFINAKCRQSFIDQFSKFKILDFNSSDENYVQLYTKQDFGKFNEEDFTGPFRITPEFVLTMIRYNKFCVKELSLSYIFESYLNDTMIELADGETSMQTLLKLFLKKDPTTFHYTDKPLNLDKLEIRDAYEAFEHIDTILNLNARDVKLELGPNKVADLPDMPITRLIADKVEKLDLLYQVMNLQVPDGNNDNFPSSKWTSFISFVLMSCPNLKEFKITVNYNDDTVFAEQVVEHFYKSVNSVLQKIFPALNEDAKIPVTMEFIINMHRFYLRDLPVNDHDLFKMGKSCGENLSEEEVSRVCVYENAVGTQHKCRFSIYESELDSVQQQQIYDDNVDVDYYDGDYYDNEYDEDYDNDYDEDYDDDL